MKIGVVGVGHMGRYHVNVLDKLKNVSLAGVYDPQRKAAAQVAQDYHTEAFESLEHCLREVEAVVLAAPSSMHYEIGKQILNHGVHVLIEKPLSNAYDKACELVELAERKKLKLMVGHIERYNGAVQELEKLVRQPYSWESQRVGPYSRRAADVGVILDLIIHDIDICFSVMGSEVKNFSAWGRKVFSAYEDLCHVHLELENGCFASFVASRVSHKKKRCLNIAQPDSNLELDFATQDLTVYRGGETLITTLPEQIRYRQQASIEKFFIHKENPLKLELLDFIQKIEQNLSVAENNSLTLKTLKLSFSLIDLLAK